MRGFLKRVGVAGGAGAQYPRQERNMQCGGVWPSGDSSCSTNAEFGIRLGSDAEDGDCDVCGWGFWAVGGSDADGGGSSFSSGMDKTPPGGARASEFSG
ncbi:hypothetical protein TcBrA4_0094310 [Trypanosoma cruzi]|nr:hypothetical protein TcBrA4_0094310 [Trypanosoma cruzi]